MLKSVTENEQFLNVESLQLFQNNKSPKSDWLTAESYI